MLGEVEKQGVKVSFDPLAVITRHGLSDGGAIITHFYLLYSVTDCNTCYHMVNTCVNSFIKPFLRTDKATEQIDDRNPAL